MILVLKGKLNEFVESETILQSLSFTLESNIFIFFYYCTSHIFKFSLSLWFSFLAEWKGFGVYVPYPTLFIALFKHSVIFSA